MSDSAGGFGLFTLLGVVFIALKLVGVITWSWWWVTVPFWGGFALFAVLAFLLMILAVVLVKLGN